MIEPSNLISEGKSLLKKGERILVKIPLENIDLLIVVDMGNQNSESIFCEAIRSIVRTLQS